MVTNRMEFKIFKYGAAHYHRHFPLVICSSAFVITNPLLFHPMIPFHQGQIAFVPIVAAGNFIVIAVYFPLDVPQSDEIRVMLLCATIVAFTYCHFMLLCLSS